MRTKRIKEFEGDHTMTGDAERWIRVWAQWRYGVDWEQRMSMEKAVEEFIIWKAKEEGRLVR